MLRKLFLYLGCLVVAVAAAWASFSTLAGLAAASGWKSGDWLLPTSIDALGAMSCWVWLTPMYSPAARSFARRTTFAVILVSVIGNGVGHLVSSGLVPAGVALIVLVGAVPPSSLAAVIHLLVLVTSEPIPDAAPVPAPVAQPAQRIVPGPAKPKPAKKAAPKKTAAKPLSQDEVDEVLVHRARKLDEDWRAQHGKPISRDDARPLLGVSNEKTGEALRLAREGVAS